MTKILIFPTLLRAKQTMEEFCLKHPLLVKRAYSNPFHLVLSNDDVWYFRTKSEGVNAYRGYNGEVHGISDFDDLWKHRCELFNHGNK